MHKNKVLKIVSSSIPFAFYALGMVYFCFRIVGFGLEFIPGDLGDSRFIHFLLEHGHRWLTGNEASFWNPSFMYPFQQTIALSDNLLGALPFYSIWRLLGFDQATAYQLWWLTACSFNFWICFLILRKWKNNVIQASILAWIFAFSLFNLGQLNYMQMMLRCMVPIAFYASIKILETPSQKYLSLYLFSIAIQLAMVMYTGIYLLYFSVLLMLVYAYKAKKIKEFLFYFSKSQIIFSLFKILVFFFSIGMFLWPYYAMSKIVGLRWYHEVCENLPSLSAFVLPHESALIWRFLFDNLSTGITNYWLVYTFPGSILLLTLLFSTLYYFYSLYKKIPLNIEIQAVILVSFLIAFLHLHFGNGISAYASIFKLPGINSIRVPVRFMHVELFLLILTLSYLIKKWKTQYLILFFVLIWIDNSFNAELIVRQKKEYLAERVKKLENQIIIENSGNKKIIAVIDTLKPVYVTQIDAMLAAQSLGLKTINGYSSYCHDAYGEFFNECNENGLNNWLNYNHLSRDSIQIIYRR